MTLTVGPNLGQLDNGSPGEGHYAELMRQWRAFDGLVMPSVTSRVAALPTSGMLDGDMYLLTATANINKLARYSTRLVTPGWEYYTPKDGWFVWSRSDQKAYRFKGSPLAWEEDASGGGGSSGGLPSRTVTASGAVTPADAGKWLICTSATPITLTIGAEATAAWTTSGILPMFHILQVGAGAVTITGDGFSVTLHGSDTNVLDGPGSAATALWRSSNVWSLIGRMVPI